MSKTRIVKVAPGKAPVIEEVHSTLGVMQEIVDGPIEAIPVTGPTATRSYEIVMSEMGAVLPERYALNKGSVEGSLRSTLGLRGTFFVIACQSPWDFRGLTEEEAAYFVERLA